MSKVAKAQDPGATSCDRRDVSIRGASSDGGQIPPAAHEDAVVVVGRFDLELVHVGGHDQRPRPPVRRGSARSQVPSVCEGVRGLPFWASSTMAPPSSCAPRCALVPSGDAATAFAASSLRTTTNSRRRPCPPASARSGRERIRSGPCRSCRRGSARTASDAQAPALRWSAPTPGRGRCTPGA